MKKSVLVVREFDRFGEILAENGFGVVCLSLIQTLPVEDLSDLDRKLEKLENYDGLFLTSPKAAEVFLRRFEQKNLAFGGKVYVLGNRTKTLFENTNFEIVFRENANTAAELIKSFDEKEFAGKKFLFVRGDKSLRAIPELLRDAAEVDETIVYRTIKKAFDERLIKRIGVFEKVCEKFSKGEIDWICFFSPSAIEIFTEMFGEISLDAVKVAAIGATTAKSAAEHNLKVDFVSSKANAQDFAFELINYIKNIE